jgi:hypothetical protein
MGRVGPPGLLLRLAVLGLTALAAAGGVPDPAGAQPLEGSTFEQSGKLRFKFKNKFGNVEPGGGISIPPSRRIKYQAEAVVVFGPAEGLAADEFAMPIAFSESLLLLTGTWSASSKGKVALEVDAGSLQEQLNELLLGEVTDCKVKAKLKVKAGGDTRNARARVKTRCRLRGFKPPQRLRVRFKGSGSELLQ